MTPTGSVTGVFQALGSPHDLCESHEGHDCLSPTADQVQSLSPKRWGQAGCWEGGTLGEEQPAKAFHLLFA